MRHLRQAIDPIGIVQLDAISVVARTQFVVLFSRVGSYPQPLLHSMAGPGGELFECAGYRAALMPLEYQRLFRWQAAAFAAYQVDGRRGAWWQAYHQANADYIEAVRRDVAERGPLTASQLRDPRRRRGEWWERRSDGRRALEFLFIRGELGAWRTPSFERVYDLVDRVIPASVLALPTPSRDEAQRALVQAAAGRWASAPPVTWPPTSCWSRPWAEPASPSWWKPAVSRRSRSKDGASLPISTPGPARSNRPELTPLCSRRLTR